jgi:hypothetical protein
MSTFCICRNLHAHMLAGPAWGPGAEVAHHGLEWRRFWLPAVSFLRQPCQEIYGPPLLGSWMDGCAIREGQHSQDRPSTHPPDSSHFFLC